MYAVSRKILSGGVLGLVSYNWTQATCSFFMGHHHIIPAGETQGWKSSLFLAALCHSNSWLHLCGSQVTYDEVHWLQQAASF